MKKVKNSEEIIYFLHCFLFSSSFLTFYNLYLLFFTVFQCKKCVSKNKRVSAWAEENALVLPQTKDKRQFATS
jgi:hypothetical protein